MYVEGKEDGKRLRAADKQEQTEDECVKRGPCDSTEPLRGEELLRRSLDGRWFISGSSEWARAGSCRARHLLLLTLNQHQRVIPQKLWLRSNNGENER